MVDQVFGNRIVGGIHCDFSEKIKQVGVFHNDGHQPVPEVVEGEDGFCAISGALVLRRHEIASQFQYVRQIILDELLGEVELMGTRHHWLPRLVEGGIRAQKEAIPRDDERWNRLGSWLANRRR